MAKGNEIERDWIREMEFCHDSMASLVLLLRYQKWKGETADVQGIVIRLSYIDHWISLSLTACCEKIVEAVP